MGWCFKLGSIVVIAVAIYVGLKSNPSELPDYYRNDHYWLELKGNQVK